MEIKVKEVKYKTESGEERIYNKLYTVVDGDIVELEVKSKSEAQKKYFKSKIVKEIK